jgi:thiol-disulfide isomerase/thioredoxin
MANENAHSRTTKSTLAALVGLGFALALVSLLFSPGETAHSVLGIGAPAPDFAFETGLGNSRKLSELRGKAVLINFWAHWCAPCLEEMESLKQLEQVFLDSPFELLLVHVGESPLEARKIPHLPSQIAFEVAEAVLDLYGVSALPHSVLVDKAGLVQQEFLGPRDWTSETILNKIRELQR